MKFFSLLIVAFLAIFSINSTSKKKNPEITVEELKKHIEFLASDEMKGRKPGSQEDPIIASYIRDQFMDYGLTLLGDNGFEKVKLVAGVKAGSKNFLSFGQFKAKFNEDFIPISFSQNERLEVNAVFVGYGYDIQTDKISWNDYQEPDVRGKWVLIFKGEPQSKERANPYEEFSALRTKVLTAKDHGAAGVLFVNGLLVSKMDELTELQYDKVESTAGIPVIHITRHIADQLLIEAGVSVADLESKINTTLQPASFELTQIVSAQTDVSLDWVDSQNIIAMVESKDSKYKHEYLVIGAHYDHLGMGGFGSGSRFPDTMAVHNGADDNASGVAGIIELAGKINSIKNKLKRSVIFIAFTGEEMGILGSKQFVEDKVINISQVKAMINFDMIGRLKDDEMSLLIGGSGTFLESDSLLALFARKHNFNLKLSPEGYGPSDHASFYGKDIPVLFISTGAHADYHSWTDDADKINYSGEHKVLNFAFELIENIACTEKTLTFQESGPKTRSGGNSYKVTLGVMPDFAGGSMDGLRVEAVRKDGPAFKGGMLDGDIIKAINGMPVSNIYDYMNRLKKLEPGNLISVDVMRENQVVVLIIQL